MLGTMRLATLLAASFLLLLVHRAHALDASNVLVLYNSASSDSSTIAQHYASVHPGVTLLGLSNVPAGEEISAQSYLTNIRPQVIAGLTSNIDVIVTTKGLPLRIDSGNKPAGNGSWNWKRYSSLESELTRVDTIGTVDQMGDQYWAIGQDGQPALASNPYYKSAQSFDHDVYGTRLTARLDGFSVADVVGSIDRAQQAVVGSSPSPIRFVVDDDPTKTYDQMPSLANQVLAPRSMGYQYDNTSSFLGTSDGNVIGYVSHGNNQASTPAGYIRDSQNGLSFQIADGAVFHTWESYNGYSFVEGGNRAGQGLVGEWLARGGSAAIGHVEEPGASVFNVANDDQIFRMMLDGYSWAEAAWGSLRQLSYVNTVVGDPLMVWHLLGDLNDDGVLTNFDAAFFEQALADRIGFESAHPDFTHYQLLGDVDQSGLFDNFDIAVFEQLLTNASGSASTAAAPVPEPSSGLLLMLGAVGLLYCCRGRMAHRRRA